MRYLIRFIIYFNVFACFAQEPEIEQSKVAIDTSVLGKWTSVNNESISSDGKFVSYNIEDKFANQVTCVIQSTEDGKEVGHFIGGSRCLFSSDSKFAIVGVSDTMCVISLLDGRIDVLMGVASFKILQDNQEQLILYETKTKFLIKRHLGENVEDTLGRCRDYVIDRNGILIWQSDSVNNGPFKLFLKSPASDKMRSIRNGIAPAENIVVSPTGKVMVYTTSEMKSDKVLYNLHWVDLDRDSDFVVNQGNERPSFKDFSADERQVLFSAGNEIWYYQAGQSYAVCKITDGRPFFSRNETIAVNYPVIFSLDGERIFFTFRRRSQDEASSNGPQVTIWNYKDSHLQSEESLRRNRGTDIYTAFLDIKEDTLIRLEEEGEAFSAGVLSDIKLAKNVLLLKKGPTSEGFWKEDQAADIWLAFLNDGRRHSFRAILGAGSAMSFELSPKEDFVIYYNPRDRCYMSYDISLGTSRNITPGTIGYWERDRSYIFGAFRDPRYKKAPQPTGYVGWMDGGKRVLIYDGSYDIWAIDPAGKEKPICMTNRYCKNHNMKLTLHNRQSGVLVAGGYSSSIELGEVLLFQGFNDYTKEVGLFQLRMDGKSQPKCILQGKFARGSGTLLTCKAKNAPIYILRRSSPSDAPNLYVVRDFREVKRLSDIQPQKKYFWYTTELVNWRLPTGDNCQGILFKPEHMEANKKYPIIFNYYVVKSDDVYEYLSPAWTYSSNPDVPFFVSRGYLIFMPDIHYTIGLTGMSALASITSAVAYLKRLPYVDSTHMALCGHSFGGYETNYIITHSNMFAAASEGAGLSNLISSYGAIRRSSGVSGQGECEVGQLRVGSTLWQRPDLYIENSPIFRASKVSTPLLILHNKLDGSVEWEQGVEMFTALRRLGKKAWMLEYEGEGHELRNPYNYKDYTIRLTEFFNFYLKGDKTPKWISGSANLLGKKIDQR